MPHPLARLTAQEIQAAHDLLADAGLLTSATRVPLLTLEEPDKADVLAAASAAASTSGSELPRRVRVLLLDRATGTSRSTVVSLSGSTVDEATELDPLTDGQPPIMMDELEDVNEIVKADAAWCKAMADRGVTDLDLVCACPLSAGEFAIPGEGGRRLVRVLSFLQHRPDDHPWAHPVDGLVAYVDLIAREVIELVDAGAPAVPAEEGNFDAAAVGPLRTTQRPFHISQPDGPSFAVDGDAVTWEGWTFRVGFNAREGLVLHQLAINDRPVLYRASVAEMVVPYGDPGPARFWQNYFDAGEYLLGQQVNALHNGCDCLGEIHYFDAVLSSTLGEPETRENAICMHEEDTGVLWKHSDLFTGSRETRRQRRLVISFWATVGNYDYGFYWHLYLDGTIELEVKSTGVLFTSAYDEGGRWATQVAPGLGAPVHQHFFCARLDMTVDGVPNAVDEIDVVPVPVDPEDNPHGNAFTTSTHRISEESDGGRLADPARGRVWRISSTDHVNRLGAPTAYVLRPQGGPTLLADPSSSIARRAAFATRHLWVTRYAPDELHPAGDYPNQHPGGAGIPAWITANRPLDGQDLVLYHTFGVTHVPRVEDWPVMPVDTCGFVLRPAGFFDRNPTLDVPG